MAKKSGQPSTSLSHKEIAVHFLEACGKHAEDKAWELTRAHAEKQGARKTTLRKAAKYLVDKHKDKRLKKYVDESYPKRGRGRALPAEGEWRDYIMQKSADGREFLRIPGKHTGVKKKKLVKVGFVAAGKYELPDRAIVIVPKDAECRRAA